MTETGNPNVYTIYNGIYNCDSVNPNIVFNGKLALTSQNDIIFLDNIETTGVIAVDSVLMTLPVECRPAKRTRIIVSTFVKTNPNSNLTVVLDIWPNGEVKTRSGLTNTNLYDIFLYGRSFNISGNYYG